MQESRDEYFLGCGCSNRLIIIPAQQGTSGTSLVPSFDVACTQSLLFRLENAIFYLAALVLRMCDIRLSVVMKGRSVIRISS
jgi:hypothetical protein